MLFVIFSQTHTHTFHWNAWLNRIRYGKTEVATGRLAAMVNDFLDHISYDRFKMNAAP